MLRPIAMYTRPTTVAALEDALRYLGAIWTQKASPLPSKTKLE